MSTKTRAPLGALTSAIERLALINERAKECTALLRRERNMFSVLEALDVSVDADLYNGAIDIRFSGDGARLRSVWRILRLNGWKPDERPENKAQAYFSTFFRKEGSAVSLFLQFSSTVCKMVQVRTETKEVPVYETVCQEGTGEFPIGEES
jgi:hypothetical protein